MGSRRAEVVSVLGLVGLLLGCGSKSKDSDAEAPAPEQNAELAVEGPPGVRRVERGAGEQLQLDDDLVALDLDGLPLADLAGVVEGVLEHAVDDLAITGAVADVEALRLAAAIVDLNGAVREDAVDVEQQQADPFGAFRDRFEGQRHLCRRGRRT